MEGQELKWNIIKLNDLFFKQLEVQRSLIVNTKADFSKSSFNRKKYTQYGIKHNLK